MECVFWGGTVYYSDVYIRTTRVTSGCSCKLGEGALESSTQDELLQGM